MPDGILQRIRQMTEDPVADSDPVVPQLRLPLTVLLLAIGAGGAVDLVLDAPQDWRSFHVLYEVALILGALGLVAWLYERGGFATMLQAFAGLCLFVIAAAVILPREMAPRPAG